MEKRVKIGILFSISGPYAAIGQANDVEEMTVLMWKLVAEQATLRTDETKLITLGLSPEELQKCDALALTIKDQEAAFAAKPDPKNPEDERPLTQSRKEYREKKCA